MAINAQYQRIKTVLSQDRRPIMFGVILTAIFLISLATWIDQYHDGQQGLAQTVMDALCWLSLAAIFAVIYAHALGMFVISMIGIFLFGGIWYIIILAIARRIDAFLGIHKYAVYVSIVGDFTLKIVPWFLAALHKGPNFVLSLVGLDVKLSLFGSLWVSTMVVFVPIALYGRGQHMHKLVWPLYALLLVAPIAAEALDMPTVNAVMAVSLLPLTLVFGPAAGGVVGFGAQPIKGRVGANRLLQAVLVLTSMLLSILLVLIDKIRPDPFFSDNDLLALLVITLTLWLVQLGIYHSTTLRQQKADRAQAQADT